MQRIMLTWMSAMGKKNMVSKEAQVHGVLRLVKQMGPKYTRERSDAA